MLSVCGLIFLLGITQAEDHCHNYDIVPLEAKRSTKYEPASYEVLLCDRLSFLRRGVWYRFDGAEIPTTCVKTYHCGTFIPLWIDGNTLPVQINEIRTAQVCGTDQYDTDCCDYKDQIRVQKCSNSTGSVYYVYELKPTLACDTAYCTGQKEPCHLGYYADFNNKCVAAFPNMTMNPTLSKPYIVNDTFVFNCTINYDPTDSNVEFEIEWLFDNRTNPDLNLTRISGLERSAILDTSGLHDIIQKIVTCNVKAFYPNSTHFQSPSYPSNGYFCGFLYEPMNITVGPKDETVIVTVIDTCPIVCNYHVRSCFLNITVETDGTDPYSVNSCHVDFVPADWNSTTHEARKNITVMASRDWYKDGNLTKALKFQDIVKGSHPPVYNGVSFKELPVLAIEKQPSMCTCSNDPWCYSFDYQAKPYEPNAKYPHTPQFEMMLPGEFLMVKNADKDFQVHIRTTKCKIGSGICICAVGAHEGKDAINIDICRSSHYGQPFATFTNKTGPLTNYNTFDGSKFKVIFPSGATISAFVDQGTLAVFVFVPSSFTGHTEGLCGTFDNNVDNDFRWKDGKTETPQSNTKPREFVESWRIPVGSSVMDTINTAFNGSKPSNHSLCPCDAKKNMVDCTKPANPFPPNGKNQGPPTNQPGRRKRAGIHVDDDDDLEIPFFFYYGLGYQPYDIDFPTPSGKTRAYAEQACQEGFNKHSTIQQCVSKIGFEYGAISGMCVEDFKYTDDIEYSLRGALRVGVMSCIERVLKNTSMYDVNNNPPEFITTELCFGDCSQHGTCVHGTCRCDFGYSGDDCKIDTRIPPTLSTYISAIEINSPLCDVMMRVCETAFVAGNNFLQNSRLSCRVEEFKFDGLTFQPTGKVAVTGVVYKSNNHVGCRLPSLLSARENVMIAYNISISNDGILFSNEVQFIRIDSTCIDCDDMGQSCAIKDHTCLIDGKCWQSGDEKASNHHLVCDPDKSKLGWTRNVSYTTADEYCKKMYSNSSYMCRDSGVYNTNYEAICNSLYCFDAINTKACVLSIPPTDFTLCASGKWCEAGSCRHNPSTLNTTDVCPLEDSSKQSVALNMNCTDLLAKRPSMCYDNQVGNVWCCESCGRLHKADPATFFGPAVSTSNDCKSIYGPSSYFCQSSYINQDYSSVCKALYCFNPVTWNCDPFPATDGVPCGNGKWCVGGQCIRSAVAPLFPTTECLYGNQYEPFCRMNVVYPNVAKFCTQNEQGCCDTCLPLKNTSLPIGCQYGDKLPDVCAQQILNKTIRANCYYSESDCCRTCDGLKNPTNSNCTYGDFEPPVCNALMNSDLGAAHCYNSANQLNCCDSCDRMKNASTPGCPYGDMKPAFCSWLFNDSRGAGNCYDLETQTQCCRSCGNAWNDSLGKGCEYGDRRPDFCAKNIYSASTAHLCFSYEDQCCLTCSKYKLSDHPECKYGDKIPTNCHLQIPDAAAALSLCPILALECCQTCGKFGHPVTGAKLVTDIFIG